MLASRRQGLAVHELIKELQAGEKSIRRDLGTLLGVGFAIEKVIGECGRKTWRLATPNKAGNLNADYEYFGVSYRLSRSVESDCG